MQRFGATAAGDSRCADVEGAQFGSRSLQLSALFTAMMESNAMLREEVEQMAVPAPPSELQTETEDTETGRSHKDLSYHREKSTDSEQLHSQSLPARRLEDSRVANSPSLVFPTVSKREGSSSESDSSDSDSGSVTDADSHSQEGRSSVEKKHTDSSTWPLYCGEPQRQAGHSLAPLPLSITSVSSSSECSESTTSDYSTDSELENDPFASPGESTIETMWDNFSVEEYSSAAPPTKQKESGLKEKPVAKSVWKRRVTIPEPFAMTIRDEGRPKRTKSRALVAAEQEKLEREMHDELECQKKFRALPVPATTYISIDEIRRRDKDERTEFDCGRIAQPIKPFSFVKREEEKRVQRELGNKSSRNNKERVVFRAKPAPQSILSPRVSEELKEKEEYRKILIKVRSQEMLAQAQLPKSMQEKLKSQPLLQKQRVGGGEQKRAFVTDEHTFRPKIRSSIPDHNQLYCQFRQKLAARRELRPATTPQPFTLRTSSTPSRCAHLLQGEEDSGSTLQSSSLISADSPSTTTVLSSCHNLHFQGKKCSSLQVPHSQHFSDTVKTGQRQHTLPVTESAETRKCGHLSSVPVSEADMKPRRRKHPTIPVTETVKMRRTASERRLAEEVEKAAEEEEMSRHKSERQRELQSRVIQQVHLYDHSSKLQEKQRQRLIELRDRDRAREAEYKQELLAMKQRVASRPLVFEQVTQDAARRAAETKYREALRKAGLSEKEIKFVDEQVAL